MLTLLSDVADGQPLTCLVDDAQWLDQSSMQALALAARRLLAEPVAMIFAVREPSGGHELAGLPAQLAGGFWLPSTRPLASRIEHSFSWQFQALPRETQRLLLSAAAEPTGDVSLLWRAAELQELGADAAVPAETAGLTDLGAQVRFRHPLIRSAVYQAASAGDRRAAHRALATATDPGVDPDRRAWHLAHAAARLDEAIAAELERSAGRAQARGGAPPRPHSCSERPS